MLCTVGKIGVHSACLSNSCNQCCQAASMHTCSWVHMSLFSTSALCVYLILSWGGRYCIIILSPTRRQAFSGRWLPYNSKAHHRSRPCAHKSSKAVCTTFKTLQCHSYCIILIWKQQPKQCTEFTAIPAWKGKKNLDSNLHRPLKAGRVPLTSTLKIFINVNKIPSESFFSRLNRPRSFSLSS